MTAPVSRYFEKAEVSIFTGAPQDDKMCGGVKQAIQTTPTHGRAALGILVDSRKSSSKVPAMLGRRIRGRPEPVGIPVGYPCSQPALRVWSLLNHRRHAVALASALAVGVFLLSVAATYFLGGQASPSSGVDTAGIQISSQPAPVSESIAAPKPEVMVAALPSDEKPANLQECVVEAPPAPAGTKELPKPLVFERLGTSVDFLRDPEEAAREAGRQRRLLFVLHVAGDFEDAALT